MTALLLAASIFPAALHAGEFLALMRKADSREEPQEKVEYYGRALKAWLPQDGQALLANCHFRRGEALFDSGKPQQSLPDLDKALALDSRNAQAYLLRGKAHLMGGRFKKAADDLGEYAVLAPQDADGLLFLGQAQRRSGKSSSALATYRKAAQLEPTDFRPRLGEGLTQMDLKRWEEAKSSLDEADLLARHRDPETLSARGSARAALGEGQGALLDYADSLPLHEARLLHLSRSSAAADEISRQKARTAETYYERGRLYERLGDPARAFLDYDQACRLDHDGGCARTEMLKPAAAKTNPRPQRQRRKKRRAAPADDSGDRIYAN